MPFQDWPFSLNILINFVGTLLLCSVISSFTLGYLVLLIGIVTCLAGPPIVVINTKSQCKSADEHYKHSCVDFGYQRTPCVGLRADVHVGWHFSAWI